MRRAGAGSRNGTCRGAGSRLDRAGDIARPIEVTALGWRWTFGGRSGDALAPSGSERRAWLVRVVMALNAPSRVITCHASQKPLPNAGLHRISALFSKAISDGVRARPSWWLSTWRRPSLVECLHRKQPEIDVH